MTSTVSNPTQALIRSAFGPSCTLYTALQCAQSSTPVELKRAYRKSALRYHPDRSEGHKASSTLKFQAVSAAYQVLMDERRRSVYDETGHILEEDDYISHNDGDEPHSSSGNAPRGKDSQKQWEKFFQSIFNEIISTGAQHAAAANSYRGSELERRDVLYHYKMCKGDFSKVVECVIHGNADDVVRWRREIVNPAVERGEVDEYGGDLGNGKCGKTDCSKNSNNKLRRRILEDSSSDDEITKGKGSREIAQRKLKQNSLLIDTDDEEDDDVTPQRQIIITCTNSNINNIMTKKDKMNYRVAKKRKVRAEKEIELAGIIQSKNWDIDSAAKSFCHRAKKNTGGISDALLRNIEKKYGNNKKERRKH